MKPDYSNTDVILHIGANRKRLTWSYKLTARGGLSVQVAGRVNRPEFTAHSLLALSLSNGLRAIPFRERHRLVHTAQTSIRKPRATIITKDQTFASALEKEPNVTLRAGRNLWDNLIKTLSLYKLSFVVETEDMGHTCEAIEQWSTKHLKTPEEIGLPPLLCRDLVSIVV
jgi:hypothetical protein